MARQILEPTRAPKAKNVLCGECQRGRHRSGHSRCGLDLCSCWCLLTPSTASRTKPRSPEWHHEDLTPTLAILRAHGVASRAKVDGSLVWKPRPSELPDEVAMMLREKLLLLACVLVPDRAPNLSPRHYWSHGGSMPCTGCGKLTILRDPLGVTRHYWCGWLRQLVLH